MTALDTVPGLDVTFYASDQDVAGIALIKPNVLKSFVLSRFRWFGPVMWQGASVTAALKRPRYDAIIYLGNPHFASTWIGAICARARGTKVLFWTHGWLRPEASLARITRNIFYNLADRVLVYSNRAIELAAKSGFPADKVTVIYNSLDTRVADGIFTEMENGTLDTLDPRDFFEDKSAPVMICTARLTDLCRFDWLIAAAQQLKARGCPINVLLVGDGPARAKLEQQARDADVSVHFYGACYDERLLGQMIYRADVTVSPGKVGLTAMHSLMYGTPVITHDNLDEQMPEVEAVIDGKTGALFPQGQIAGLADTIQAWLNREVPRAQSRAACRAEIAERWTAAIQVHHIHQALKDVLHVQ